MADKNLPSSFKGYSTQELLKVWDELQTTGTSAPREKIQAMSELLREYRLGLFEAMDEADKT